MLTQNDLETMQTDQFLTIHSGSMVIWDPDWRPRHFVCALIEDLRAVVGEQWSRIFTAEQHSLMTTNLLYLTEKLLIDEGMLQLSFFNGRPVIRFCFTNWSEGSQDRTFVV